jgi:asparagine N-glycosylation enzyme membrane subunit Stt3
MPFLTRLLPSFLASWLLTFTLASLFHSQYVVNQLVNVDVAVSFSDRVSLTLADWLGLLPTYGAIIAIALAIAFFVASWFNKKFINFRAGVFIVAGVAAFTAVLIAIESIMNIHLIAGARGWGFYTQLFAGSMGGYTFSVLMQNSKKEAFKEV